MACQTQPAVAPLATGQQCFAPFTANLWAAGCSVGRFKSHGSLRVSEVHVRDRTPSFNYKKLFGQPFLVICFVNFYRPNVTFQK